MEITQKIRDMIMSDDKELQDLVNVILDKQQLFTYNYQGNNFSFTFPIKGHCKSSIREVIKLRIRILESMHNSIPN